MLLNTKMKNSYVKVCDDVKIHISKGDNHSDFLFLFLMGYDKYGLASKLATFYAKEFGNDKVFSHSAAQEGRIDLERSENKARIMTVVGSQGTGRKNVYIIDLTQKILNYFKTTSDHLKGASLLHVALTRAIYNMKIFINSKDLMDPISERIINGSCSAEIKHSFAIGSLSSNIDLDSLINKIEVQYETKIKEMLNPKSTDYNYNIKRYELSVWIGLYKNMQKSANGSLDQQITVLEKISASYKVEVVSVSEAFRKRYQNKDIEEYERYFETDKKIYLPNFEGIETFKIEIERIQNEIKKKKDFLDQDILKNGFIYVFLMNYFMWKTPCFHSEFEMYKEIYETEDKNKDFLETFIEIEEQVKKLEPFQSKNTWYHNVTRNIEWSYKNLTLKTSRPLSYNSEGVYIYYICPSFSGLELDRFKAEFLLTGYIYRNMDKTKGKTNHPIPETSNINFVIISCKLKEPFIINYQTIENQFENNKEIIINSIIEDKSCENILYELYQKTESKNNQEKCDKCRGKLDSRQKFYKDFFEDLRTKKDILSKEKFCQKYKEYLTEIVKKMFEN